MFVNHAAFEEGMRHQRITSYTLMPRQASEQADYQVLVENIPSLFEDDLRMIQNKEEIPFWVEEKGAAWTKINKLFVNTPQLLFALSGNPSASSASDGDNTFLFFDDFESYDFGDFVANSKWNVYKEAETSIKIEEVGYTRFGYYNGNYDESVGMYKIGMAIPDSSDLNLEKCVENPIISPETGFLHVKDPWVIYVDGTYYLYAAMYTASGNYEIHMWTSSDGISFSHDSTCIQKGSGGSWDDEGVSFPCVFYDEDESDPTKKWKMFYGGDAGSNKIEIGYAYSANGTSWTKYASNPVVQTGSAGAWDDRMVHIPRFVKRGTNDYYLYYGGNNASEGQWLGIGLVTFSDFEGTYTKQTVSNPLLSRRHDANKQLTAQTSSGSKIVTVADTSVFEVNEPVFLQDLSSNEEFNRVASKDSATQLTLENNTIRNYPTNCYIRSWMYNSISPSQIIRDSATKWRMYFVGFRGFTGELHEVTAYATSSDGQSWTIDYANSPPLPFDYENGEWDDRSAENLMVVDRKQSTEIKKVMVLSTKVSADGKLVRLASVGSYNDFIEEAKIKWAESKNAWIDFRGQTYNMLIPNGYYGIKQYDNHGIDQYNSGWTNGADQNVSLSTSAFYKAKIIAHGSNQQWLVDSLTGSNLVDRSTLYSAFSTGYIGFSSYGSFGDDTRQLIDFVFIRNSASLEPLIVKKRVSGKSDMIKAIVSGLVP